MSEELEALQRFSEVKDPLDHYFPTEHLLRKCRLTPEVGIKLLSLTRDNGEHKKKEVSLVFIELNEGTSASTIQKLETKVWQNLDLSSSLSRAKIDKPEVQAMGSTEALPQPTVLPTPEATMHT